MGARKLRQGRGSGERSERTLGAVEHAHTLSRRSEPLLDAIEASAISADAFVLTRLRVLLLSVDAFVLM
jgi:hypothetical protein